jgi:hypothetical protein
VGTGGGRPPPVTRWVWKRSYGRPTKAPPDERGGNRHGRTLLDDLATLTRNTLVTAIAPEQPFTLIARPTPVQQRARDLLGFSRTQ